MITLHLQHSINRSSLRLGLLVIPLVLVCFGLSPTVRAVSPAPDGAYPNSNTAEGGISALFSLTTGSNNVALGVQAMEFNTSGSMNTATGFAALFDNTSGLSNTATGTEALLMNTTANNNSAFGAFALFSNTTGERNTATGFAALFSNTDVGAFNTATGSEALETNTTGLSNTATGTQALLNNTIANNNTANGAFTLSSNTTGGDNTASGFGALFANTSGTNNVAIGSAAMQAATGSNVSFNTAVGWNALVSTTANANVAVGDLALNVDSSGHFNTAIGAAAGSLQTTGSGNVYIGQGIEGVAGENNHTYIKNIQGTSVSGAGTDTVTINLSTGLLGHLSSSRRYKEEIKSMDSASETLYRLKPVTYRYKKEIDASQSLDYGLVAEDVAAVDPNLAIRDGNGQIESVRYNAIYNMMLNEFIKAHKKVQELEATVVQQQKGMEALVAQVKEQAAQIQKVSEQIEMSKPTPKVVTNQ